MTTGRFTGDQKPTREGVYRRVINGGRIWSRWFGGTWRVGSPFHNIAAIKTDISNHQSEPWKAIIK